LLKAMVFAESEKIAAAALDGATSLEVSVSQRASHALKLIELLEPSVQIGVSMTMPDNAEGVESLTLSQLLSLAEQEQIVVPQSLQRKD
jgi:hypothetical protein